MRRRDFLKRTTAAAAGTAAAVAGCGAWPARRLPFSTMTSDQALLAVDGLRKLYPVGKHRLWQRAAAPSFLHAVDDVSFTIARGETVGLVGESGCGKSTIARLIARLIDASDGSIRFDGEEIGRVPAHRFGRAPQRAQIQMVFQDAADSLNPRFTAFRAIADPLLRLQRLSGTALRARVEEVARLTGLPQELLTRFPHQLSGGQKARVGIARAIAVEPRLLILDEPTSALDVSVQVVILRLLRDLKRQLDLSYLFRQPRPQCRAAFVRPHPRDVSRPYRRKRAGRSAVRRACASLHAGVAVGGTHGGRRPRAVDADRLAGRAPQPDRSGAAYLPAVRPVRAGDRKTGQPCRHCA
jgi:ABC-type glutathione transport system ATPase component